MKLILPLSVTMPRKKASDRVWILNLNSYRNTHFQILNKCKIAWTDVVKLAYLVPEWQPMGNPPFIFTYTIFPANKRSFDIANVCSVIDKFTCDALIDLGILKEDNHKLIPKVVYQIGTVDKENPRCELLIESVSEATAST